MSRLHVNLFSSMLLLTGIYTERIIDVRTIIDITRIKYYVYQI